MSDIYNLPSTNSINSISGGGRLFSASSGNSELFSITKGGQLVAIPVPEGITTVAELFIVGGGAGGYYGTSSGARGGGGGASAYITNIPIGNQTMLSYYVAGYGELDGASQDTHFWVGSTFHFLAQGGRTGPAEFSYWTKSIEPINYIAWDGGVGTQVNVAALYTNRGHNFFQRAVQRDGESGYNNTILLDNGGEVGFGGAGGGGSNLTYSALTGRHGGGGGSGNISFAQAGDGASNTGGGGGGGGYGSGGVLFSPGYGGSGYIAFTLR